MSNTIRKFILPISDNKIVVMGDLNSTIWFCLRRYQNIDFVRKYLKDEIKGIRFSKLIDQKAGEISTLMIQAEAYYQAASVSPLNVRSVLQYYGAVCLAKILILSGDNKYLCINLESGHGISNTPDKSNSADFNIRNNEEKILEEYCYFKKEGIYPLLRRCYSKKPLIKKDKKGNKKNAFRMTISELLAYYSEKDILPFDLMIEKKLIKHPFPTWRDVVDEKHCLGLEDKVKDFFNSLPKEFQRLYQIDGQEYVTRRKVENIEQFAYISRIMGSSEIHKFFLPKIKKNKKRFSLCDIDVHFSLMFILGSLARYSPKKWSTLVQQHGESAFTLVEHFMTTSHVKFPYLILCQLDRKNYLFN